MNDQKTNKFLELIKDEFQRLHQKKHNFILTESPTKAGCYLDGQLYQQDELQFKKRAPVNFVLKKDSSIPSKRVITANIVTYAEKTVGYYSTPRAGCPGACQTLTKRAQGDLASQLRYNRDYIDMFPDPQERGTVTAPRFAEYLQGFHQDWTDPSVTMPLVHRAIKAGVEKRLSAIDLFSGIGGLTLASDTFLKPIQYCEVCPDARSVLIARMADGSIDSAPIHHDINTLDASLIAADVVIGGFPCQDVSTMGKRKGFGGEKSVLFFQAMRIAKECNAKVIILENVKGIINCGGGSVFNDMVTELDSNGYDFKFHIVEACHAGAAHRRSRFFLIALRRDLIISTTILPAACPQVDLRHDPFWDSPFPPVQERMIMRMSKLAKARLKQLGNVVCPLQGRLAMRSLIPGL